MGQTPPDRIGGCIGTIFGGLFALFGLVFLVVAVLGLLGVIQVQMNGPAWLFVILPVVFIAVGGMISRIGWSNLTRPRPKPTSSQVPQEVARATRPLLFGFLATSVISFGGVVVALFVLNAPGWVIPVVFFVPVGVYILLMRSSLSSLAGRLARAVPSPESRAALPAGPERTPPLSGLQASDPVPMTGDWPTVPTTEPRPGRELAHSLDLVDPYPGCTFGCAVFVALLWNGIVSIFAVPLIRQLLRGNVPANWWQALFLIPFVLVGLVLIGYALLAAGRWVVATLAGRVEVEVSAHPIAPGGRYDMLVSQRGPFRLGGLAVALVCEEAATYTAGTTKATDRKVVARHLMSDPDRDGKSPPLTAVFEVPADAMHSFKTSNNEIAWKVRVTGRVLGVFPYSADFAVVVRPESALSPGIGEEAARPVGLAE